MGIEHNTEVKKRRSGLETPSQSHDPSIYLVTVKPTLSRWSMTTVSNGSYVEVIPVFDSEEQALDLIESLEDDHYQPAMIPLSRLKALVDEHQSLFILNPEAAVEGGQLFLKENPNWGLSLDRLYSLLLTPVKNSG